MSGPLVYLDVIGGVNGPVAVTQGLCGWCGGWFKAVRSLNGLTVLMTHARSGEPATLRYRCRGSGNLARETVPPGLQRVVLP